MRLIAMSLFFGVGLSAYGDTVTFTFNSLTVGSTDSAIAAYMTSMLVSSGCVGCSVTVNSGGGTVYVDTTYTGDGHVVGPGGTADTLGNTTGATNNGVTPNGTTDAFISNVSNSSVSGGSQIDLQFNGLTFDGVVSFDYEIFPDGSCPQLNSASCGGGAVGGIYPNQPDFELKSGLNGGGISLVSAFGTNGIQYGATPSSTGADGNSTKSSASSTELAPQWIGVFSTSSINGENDLNFIDWPAAIGVDNLTITYDPPGGTVPETSSLLLLGTVSILLIPAFRRCRKAGPLFKFPAHQASLHSTSSGDNV